jgi:hypothetical protein
LFYHCNRPVPTNIDTKQLQKVQDFFQEFEAVGSHPGLVQSFESTDSFESRIREDLIKLLFDYSRQLLVETREPELAERMAELEESAIKPEEPEFWLPFTNRQDELDQILSVRAPAYHLIDAPARYGKTVLLEELKARFEERNWCSVYISLQNQRSLLSISETVARAANLNVELTSEMDARQLGLNLGNALVGQRKTDFGSEKDQKKGLVLLVDVDKRPWTWSFPQLDALFIDFIPGLEYTLRRIEYFDTKHNAFRVVFAGRYVAGKTPPGISFNLTIKQLSPFSYKIIHETIGAYLREKGEVSQLAGHLMYFTGGHPGCIAKILKMYETVNYPPDDFFRYSGEEIWQEKIWPEIDAIRMDINSELRRIFDELSIFRYLDYGVLRSLLDRTPIPDISDEFNLADVLTNTYLLSWDGRLLKDDITRRLLALRFLREIGHRGFSRYCQDAQKICGARLQDPTTQAPERWAIEYLFQDLQQHAGKIQDDKQRTAIRKTFFETTLPTAMDLFLKKRDARIEKQALKQALEKDSEFGFTVNYYLRTDQYNNEPYEELEKMILPS